MKTKQIGLLMVLLAMVECNAKSFDEDSVVAITILAEARGEGRSGMYAVACVIQQRVIERKLSASMVCMQAKQFSCWNSTDPQHAKLNSLLKLPEAKYALQLASNLKSLDRSFTGYANHYHTSKVNPTWSRGKNPVKIIGNHRFFKL